MSSLRFLHSFRVITFFLRCKVRRIEEIRGGITNIFEEICQNLAQNLRSIEEIPHMYAIVNLTCADVMSSNITVHSIKDTMLSASKKWTFYTKLNYLYYIILKIWTHIISKCNNICKCTGWLKILCSKNPVFSPYFMIQFLVPGT